MFVGELVRLKIENPFVALGIRTKSFALVMVGGEFVLNQRFNGPLAKSRMFVAKSAATGTLTTSQLMPPGATMFVEGTPLVGLNGGSTVTVKKFVALKVWLVSAKKLVSVTIVSKV